MVLSVINFFLVVTLTQCSFPPTNNIVSYQEKIMKQIRTLEIADGMSVKNKINKPLDKFDNQMEITEGMFVFTYVLKPLEFA